MGLGLVVYVCGGRVGGGGGSGVVFVYSSR